MDLAFKTVLTATLVTTIVLFTRWLSEYAAGMLSGLPFTTVPAVLLAGNDLGAVAAAKVAVGGVVGCALACLFAFAYHRAARRLPPLPTLAVAVSVLVAALAAAHAVRPGLSLAVTLAVALGGIAFEAIGRPAPLAEATAGLAPMPTSAAPQPMRAALPKAMVVGALAAAIAPLVLAISPSLAGMVAAMPMVVMAAAPMQHAARGRQSVTHFLRGYVVSSMLRAVFCASFAILAMHASLVAALLCALGLSLAGPSFGWLVARRLPSGRL